MDIQTHKKVLAWVHISTGALKIVVYLLASLFIGALFPFIEAEIIREDGPQAAFVLDIVSSAFTTIIGLSLAITAIPSIIGGIGLLFNKNWSLVVLLVAGCLSILSFPVGTAIGIYSIWVFVKDQKIQKEGSTQLATAE